MKFYRMLSILLTVENKGKTTAKELAKRLETSTRTIYRDIDALCEAGIPIVSETGPNGGISLLNGYQTEIKQIEKEDIVFLYLNGIGFKAEKNSEIAIKSSVAVQKLEKILSKEDRVDFDALKKRFYIDNCPWWEEQKRLKNIDALYKALWISSKLYITYYNREGDASSRLIRPYGIVIKNAEWYLVAYCESSRELRIFKCERIVDYKITYEYFVIPDNFSLEHYFQSSVKAFENRCIEEERYFVKIKIMNSAYEIIKDCEIEIQSVEKFDDYSIITTNMYSHSRALCEFWNILLHAEVVEPEELREYVINKLKSALRLYPDK